MLLAASSARFTEAGCGRQLAHICNPNAQASLSCVMNSRTAWATKQDPLRTMSSINDPGKTESHGKQLRALTQNGVKA